MTIIAHSGDDGDADAAPTAKIAQFVETIFEAEDRVELRLLPRGIQRFVNATEVPQQARWLMAQNQAGQNIYIGVNPRLSTGGSTNADVSIFRCVFVDFDDCSSAEEAVTRVKAAGLPLPTMTVWSGHGLHLYWRLDEPITDPNQWRALQRRLIAALKSDPAIHDPARIMRLPGFFNLKREPPIPVDLLEADPNRRYQLAELTPPIVASTAPPTGARPANEHNDGKVMRYLQRAVERELQAVRSAAQGSRNTALNKASYNLGRLVDGRRLRRDEIESKLYAAAKATGLGQQEIAATIKSGLDAGAKRPRTIAAKANLGQKASGKVKVIIDTDESRVVDETIRALGTDSTVYQRGGTLVRVLREAQVQEHQGVKLPVNLPRITLLPRASLREKITKVVTFKKITTAATMNIEVETSPPAWLVEAVDARGEWHGIRPLRAVSDIPILHSDGSIFQTAGYDSQSGVLYEPSAEFPCVPDNLTKDCAIRAAHELLDPVCDFHFERPEHRAAWLASILTVVARFGFSGPAPLFLFDANVRGAGKGLLTQVNGRIVLGREIPVFSYAHNTEEMRKKITCVAIAGDRLVLLDNLAGKFGNDALDRALTSTAWKDRILGRSELVELPLQATWYATGNNVAVAADTTRRIIHIRLDVLKEHPEDRIDFVHPHLLEWVMQNRGRLLCSAMTIIAAFIRAGRPPQNLSAFGSFEEWSGLIREAIVWTGQPDPCLTRTRLVEYSDTGTDTLGQLIVAWRKYDPSAKGVVVADLLTALYPRDNLPNDDVSVEMRAAIEEFCGCPPGKVPASRQLGNKLRAVRRRVIDGCMLDINAREKRRGGAVWRVLAVNA